MATFGLVAKSADDFIADIIDLNHEKALEAFRKLVLNRRNPDLDEYEVLDNLRKIRPRLASITIKMKSNWLD